ncbi:cytochrome P450 [Phlegmacium glaucopus]|nr:cytochrome P450 [Phlegmacium glaucopus]
MSILTLLCSLGLILFDYLLYRAFSGSFNKNSPTIRQLGGFPLYNAWMFFHKRYDFLWYHFRASPDSYFKFKVLQHTVVALRGEDARKAFFDNKSMNSLEGHKILVGGIPRLDDIAIDDTQTGDATWFNKHIATMLNKSRITDVLPTLLDDAHRRMDMWGKDGRIDPFKDIYDLVFQMTVRMASCAELSSNIKAVEEIQNLYWTLEKSSTPTSLLLPWFPGPAKKRRQAATKELFTKLEGYVEMRRNAAVPSSDMIDILSAQGADNQEIVGFILGVIFAGLVNTGVNTCWTLVYLATHSEWKTQVQAEVNLLLQKYTNSSSDDPLHKRLSTVHVSVWEDEMPILESVIRETMRIAISGVALRRNLIEDLTLSGGLVQRGDFVVYSLADVHLDPEIYPNPLKFDPTRYNEGRKEDKKTTFGYLGWGAGRHPCSGMRFAKLEIKIIVALMVVGFEFDLVDSTGKRAAMPQPDRNDLHMSRPLGDPCFLQFRRIVD